MSRPYVRKKFFLVLMLLILFLFQATAQQKPMITVLPFSSIEVPAYVSQIISQLFETHLVNTKAYDVLSQNEREQILAAQSESLEGCTDESCAIEIGRLLAAEQVILGTVAALGTKYIINAKIIDVTTSKTLGADMISAASVEELDNACKTLTYSLVQKALPTAVVEAVPEPAPAPEPEPAPAVEGEVAEEPEPEPEVEPEPTPEPEPEVAEEPTPPAPKPKPVRPTGGGINKVLIAGGAVLQTAGNFTNAVAYPLLIESERIYQQYLATELNPGELFESDSSSSTYYDYYDDYAAFSYGSLGLSGAGGAVLGTQPFVGGGSSFSTLGKIVYSAGLTAMAAGNIFGQMAVAGYTQADGYYNDYLAASEGTEALWSRYERAYDEYAVPRYTSYGLWGSGMAMMVSAAFLPGTGTSSDGFLNKILYTAGSLLLSGGNAFAMMAQNTLVESRRAYDTYADATTVNFDSLYQTYDDAYCTYETLTYTAYGLWIGGAVLAAVSLFIPGSSGAQTAELPFGLDILPAPVGYGAEIHIQTR